MISIRRTFKKYLSPSSLLITSDGITIDLLIQVLLYSILNPIFTWGFTIPLLIYTTNGNIWIQFSLFIDLCWCLRYINIQFKSYKFNNDNRNGLNIIITGGSNGLGLEIVRQFIENNKKFKNLKEINKIIILDVIKSSKLENLINDYPTIIKFLKVDFSDELNFNAEKCLKSINNILNKNQNIDILVCNAGVRQFKEFNELSNKEIHEIFQVNYFSQALLIQSITRSYNNTKSRLHIITISSILGFISPKKLSIYSGTKSSLINLIDSLRYELSSNIILSLIIPGQLTTKMFKDVKVDNSFLAPLIDHIKLSERVLEIIDHGYNGIFIYPFYGRLIPLIRSLPFGLYQFARWFSNMDDVI